MKAIGEFWDDLCVIVVSSSCFVDTIFAGCKGRCQSWRTRDLTLKLQEQGTLVFLSTLVVSEAYRLILYKIGIIAGHRFLDQFFLQAEKGFARVLPADWEVVAQARRLLDRFSDQDVSLTDAISAVLMRQNAMHADAGYVGFSRLWGPKGLHRPEKWLESQGLSRK